MELKVKISHGQATVREWHKECETVLGREVGGNLSGREEKWCAIELDSNKLLGWLTTTRDNFTWKPKPSSLQFHVTSIQSGTTIDAPVMCSDLDTDGSIRFVDGRHRTVALQQLGATKIPVMVPKSQIKLFLDYLG
ncbi:ParB N-terminal domain-containing protein [Xanthomonas floridensis]|uniref:ParB N-terminal domain-containing protein n=1 Tax=Xanthomonas floridensis TaxID=1843580 RepID=A0ABU5Q1J6_9XANT|nr:ParB N-terminal domain-containing protein [Xanthomonas floridensis]MEA5125349.1 ParB N-terminal domain-containing protein [Xanthomonas floridensis]MEA5133245.1 ParB N-terminal domain-containing protein [Xanthomonas floridensis]